MKPFAIDPGEIEDGLDRQNLTRIRRRFVAINSDRLDRLRNALTERQQTVLDALPLLFHTNHPMMPGFDARNTPSRLCNYTFSKKDQALGRNIARSFTANIDITQPEQIYGIYVMGSVGTIAQSESSDLDIWLCYRPGLERNAIESLNRKCEKISEWAMQSRLEVHFFLMDHDAFRQGKLSALNEESSGSAQRLLLLDEFYRTAIYLGGCMPLWWFVPVTSEDQYPRYTNILLGKRFIKDDVLDFGGIATIPDGEFVGAGIWQLYKAIESPYKSVLKLLLLESYADQYPDIKPLSLTFKAQVYAGELDINQLDSYVMIYRRIENYLLQKQQLQRLELARRCFYFKVNKPLTKPITGREKSWQRKLLEELVASWQWDHKYLELLDARRHWKTPEVDKERSLLVSELNHGYRFLQDFAAHTRAVRAISSEELTILGRKLQAAFERRPGKIEWINPGISNDISESQIIISQSTDPHGEALWTASARVEDITSVRLQTIKNSSSLVELILWCYFNGVITTHTRFDLLDAPAIDEFNLLRLLKSFHQWLPLPLPNLKHNAFKRTAEPTEVLVLINVACSPTERLDTQGIQRLSNQTDALSYSGFEENLVVSIDLVVRNSWNEINSRRFDKKDALLDALHDYLKLSMPGSHHRPPNLHVECIGSSHATTISSRIRSWFAEIVQCYYGGQYPPASRYVFEMAGLYNCLQFKGPRLITRQYPSVDVLQDALSEEQPSISPICIDSRALNRHPLRAICEAISGDGGGRSWSGSINVFYQRSENGVEMYVIDEHGTLVHRYYKGRGEFLPLKPLHHFLRAIVDRQTQLNQELLYDFGIFPIHFYELTRDSRQTYHAQPKRIANDLNNVVDFEVRAVGFVDELDQLQFNFYCSDQEFPARTLGNELFLVVAQYIIGQRKSSEFYPVYITDLDLSLCIKKITDGNPLTTSHYLKLKNRLELKLNRAIGILMKA